MFIPDPGFEFFASWIRIVCIPDTNFFHPGSRIHIKKFKYINPKKWFLSSWKYDPGCSSRIRIPDPNFLHPGSIFFPSRIRIKEFKYFTPKIVSKLSEIWSGLSSRIRKLTFYPSRIPVPGVKKAPDPGISNTAIRATDSYWTSWQFSKYDRDKLTKIKNNSATSPQNNAPFKKPIRSICCLQTTT